MMGCRPSRFLTCHLNSTASSLCFSSIILVFTKNIGSKRASVPRLSAPKSTSDRPPPRRPLSCPEHFVVFCAPPPGIKSSETRRSSRAGWTPRRRFPQTSRCFGNGPVWRLEGSRLTELKTMIPHPRETATTDNAQRREQQCLDPVLIALPGAELSPLVQPNAASQQPSQQHLESPSPTPHARPPTSSVSNPQHQAC